MESSDEISNSEDLKQTFGSEADLDNFVLNKDEEVKENENKEKKTKKKSNICSKFPSSYVVLLGFEVFSYILTFIIQKGKYRTIEYSKQGFIIKFPNETTNIIPANQEELTKLNIKIPFENFVEGLITKPVAIPNTYEKVEADNISFFSLFINPVKGVINSMDISLFIMLISGAINILVETKAMDAGIQSLIKCTKGKEFLLLCLIFIVFTVCGTTIGMIEQSFCFYQILMPVFLKSNIDPMIAVFSIYPATMIGTMFSICYPASVVLASYLAGIHFTEGLVFRLISLIIAIPIIIGYLYYYHRKVKKNPSKSISYNIIDDLEQMFIKKDKNENSEKKENDGENKNLAINEDDYEKKDNDDEKKDLAINENDYEKKENDDEKKDLAINEDDYEKKDNDGKKDNNNENVINEENEQLIPGEKSDEDKDVIRFTWTRIISILLFIFGFIFLIVGVAAFGWYFEEMSALFFGLSILLMFLSREKQAKAISIFIKGTGDMIGTCFIIGICRGIYLTLDEGKINDTLLYGLSKLFEGIAKELFALAMLLVFMILGFFIPSSTGLATLSIPIFAPLADAVDVSRTLVINAFMFSLRLLGLISPTSFLLIACELSGIPFILWVKFIYPLCLILLVYLIILILINSTF